MAAEGNPLGPVNMEEFEGEEAQPLPANQQAGIQECAALRDTMRSMELVREFTPSVFRDELPPGLPPDRGIDPVIKLPSGTKPPFGPLYRMSPRELETLKRQIADLLAKGHIVPSTAAFGAPCLFATKKDSDELRLVVKYRNALSLPNRGTATHR